MVIRKINKIICIFSLIIYLSVIISPAQFWIAGFIAILIPLVLILHFLFIIYWLIKKSKYVFFSLFILLLGFPFIKASFSFNNTAQYNNQSDLTVLSYNVRLFNLYEYRITRNIKLSKQIIKWVQEDDSDIKCFQEYYYNNRSSQFNTTKKLENKGEYDSFVYQTHGNKKAGHGIAIFSRFPIIHNGSIIFKENENNIAIYADISVNDDTIRIINAHLASMSIHITQSKFYEILSKLKKGFIQRAIQTELLTDFIENSSYPVILCIDLNDTPYSYAYIKFCWLLSDTFEYLGKGFGFTYNHPIPFLRIDYQFYDKKFSPIKHKNYYVNFTDHFPLKVSYTIKN